MTDLFKQITKSLKDENTNLAADRNNSSEATYTMDTGSYLLNAALSASIYGGVMGNKITAIAGDQATGKTFFALGILREWLNNHPDGACFYFDTESAVTVDMLEERGLDTSRIYISEPNTVQKFRHTALQILERYMEADEADRKPMMMILDSLGQLSTTKELEDTVAGSETRDMTRAQVIKATFRTINLKLAKANVPLIVTNHTYSTMDQYNPREMSGGSGLKFSASTIIFLSKKKDKDGKEVIGNIIHCKMNKNRFAKENVMVDVQLSYKTGLNKYYGLLELAEEAGVFPKEKTRYNVNGKLTWGKTINENPEEYFTQEVLDKINEYAKSKFSYGDVVYDYPGLDKETGEIVEESDE